VIIENSFEVPGSPEDTLKLLLDPERVVPCMPGAELVEVVDDKNWRAKMRVRLGPVGMDFDNKIELVEIDEANGVVKMNVSGRDTRGKGGADGTVEARFAAADGGTRVEMTTDLRFSGQAAQLGRPNVVQDVASKLVGDFAGCLGQQMKLQAATKAAIDDGDPATVPPPPPPSPAAKPLSGFAVLVAAVAGAIKRLFRKPPAAKPLLAFAGLTAAVAAAIKRLLRKGG
jgi:carbon monoxide dehydrogenase subunit G